MSKQLSPMMRQYFKIKEEHKDHIVFFRLGDFYEMFYEDAKLASEELELTLTGRDCGEKERAPMCGVPYHSCEAYIARLIKKGYKVAIAEQTEAPTPGKGIVNREVVRVITPGTVIEGSILDESRNNFIASVFLNSGQAGLCFADISTGEIHATVLSNPMENNRLLNEIGRFAPSETLVTEKLNQDKQLVGFLKNTLNSAITVMEDLDYDKKLGQSLIETHFQKTTEDLGLNDKPCLVSSLGALLTYLKSTQKKGTERLNNFYLYSEKEYMYLDLTARANLELVETVRGKDKKGSLLWVLDKTNTAMGKRLLRTLIEQPLMNPALIERRLAAVEQLLNNHSARDELSEILKQCFDLERLMTRIVYGSAMPKEFLNLGATIKTLPNIQKIVSELDCLLLKDIFSNIDLLEDVGDLIDKSITPDPPATTKDGGYIKLGYNEEVDRYRDIIGNGRRYISEMEERVKTETGIKNLKIGYNKVFGYYIDVTKSNIHLVPDTFIRRQTLTGSERYITDELKELENEILNANEKIISLERTLFEEVRKEVAMELHRIQRTASSLALLDVLNSFAKVAFKNNYCRPIVGTHDKLEIRDGRHPVVEVLTDSMFVPNDVHMDNKDNNFFIITGPNMAGKSTYMRQIALIVIMAQIGCFVPAKSANIGMVDKVFTRVGASDDLSAGQSTFMVEMSEVANILENATSDSLLILDEIGRGTSTFDGMSIAKSVVEFIVKKIKAKTLFATHYHELTQMEDELKGVRNFNIAVKKRGDDITFLRRIVAGGADQSYGIEVADLAGVPKEVVRRSKEILKKLEEQDIILHSKQKARKTTVSEVEEMQIGFSQNKDQEILEEIKKVDINTLTPIEALNVLYEIHKKLK